jgi:hypothetical protein
MPLIVHCPNGCVIRVPRARAGTIVRCVECKTIIQLRNLTPSELAETHAVEMHATFPDSPGTSRSNVSPSGKRDPVSDAESPNESGPRNTTGESLHRPRNFPPLAPDDDNLVVSNRSAEAGEDQEETDSKELLLPIPKPVRLRFNVSQRRRGRRNKPARAVPNTVREQLTGVAADGSDETEDWDSIRIDEDIFEFRSDDEFRFLTQFFAACIGFMGLVLIVPSMLAWGGWAALPVEPMGSRWIFIMIFLGALHLMYAVFLFQVPERSALWAISIFLLIVGCIHGIFTIGTWLDGGNGPISRFLQLPSAETAAVTLWCFLHLCFSALLS